MRFGNLITNYGDLGSGREHLAASLINRMTMKAFVVRRKEYGD